MSHRYPTEKSAKPGIRGRTSQQGKGETEKEIEESGSRMKSEGPRTRIRPQALESGETIPREEFLKIR
jgi:hypothetical protein